MATTVLLRDIREDDLRVFFEQECDPVANLMAAYPARDEETFMSHWKDKILGDDAVFKKTIIYGDSVAGNVECWPQGGKWLVGYWLGKEYWGKGIATAALREFLQQLKMRPLYAYVASHNKASARVLEKCGFTVSGHGMFFSKVHEQNIEETIFTCN